MFFKKEIEKTTIKFTIIYSITTFVLTFSFWYAVTPINCVSLKT